MPDGHRTAEGGGMELDELGLVPDEATVYRMLIARTSVRAEAIGDAAGLPAERATAALRSLVARGLVVRAADGHRYSAAPPAVALGAELAAHRERLQRAEVTVARLAETYRMATADRAQRELVEIVEGSEAIGTRYRQLQLSARRTIDIFSAGRPQAVTPADSEEVTAMARDVRVRAVIDQGFLREPGAAENVAQSLADGVRVRTVTEVPYKLILCDESVAMLPLHGRDADVDPAVVLRGGLAHMARELFEQVWERASPYQEAAGVGIDPVDVHILRLLLAGLTDTAVATQVGLSARTVQRRIQLMMSHAGATSRLQLGWYAGQHGWV
ncbi:helix-turn-helix domain-containing protein [Streptomyces sp. NBC_01257]|uniref:helix-turn-helix domain-containing protein n=1 Tax=Streptomyces sp. NBC_01257 TaxID=2903799 RepID=UPI002DDAB88F|nr:helix-turn-helix domain-containing protein [Streptomyces sp. NBC_01257]WRZ66348.1 helix-turn-helix transcriptional regulator [Streptomyces sp. NBC_01257]